ncbi:protein NEDD1-like isoform X2 [Ambystoma mexicanum]|uniref:protein NEDD1-like isoform X2 n=1 Tax=Ambystoma mexicanum TaxID=8296 RepID=UPI0037E8A3F4
MQESTRFASAGEDIKIWDYSSMSLLDQFNPHKSLNGISSLCWSAKNDVLASAAGTGDKIVISSCKSKRILLFELAERKRQTCLHLHSNCKFLVSGGPDKAVNIWELNSRRLHRSLKAHKDEVTCVRFSGDDGCIASGSVSGEIILHSVSTNLSSSPFGHGSFQPIQSLKYSFLKTSLFGTASSSGTVSLWDANSQSCYHTFDCAHKAQASDLCFSPVNDLLLVSIGLDKMIQFYDTSKKHLFKSVVAESPLTAVDFTPDGCGLTIGSSRGMIYQYDLRMLTSPVRKVCAHKSSIQSIQFQHGSLYAKSKDKVSLCRSSLSSVNTGEHLNENATLGERKNSNMVADISSRISIDGKPAKETNDPHCEDLKNKYAFWNTSICEMFSPIRDDISNRISIDGKPSNETNYPQCEDLKNKYAFWNTSLYEMFSPIRDDIYCGNILDVLPPKETDWANGVQLKTKDACWRSKPDTFSPLGNGNWCKDILDGKPLEVTDCAKCMDFKTQDAWGSSNLDDIFSPVRDEDEKYVGLKVKDSPWCNGLGATRSPVREDSKEPTYATNAASSSENRSTSLTSTQINIIKRMIHDAAQGVGEACHREILHLEREMIRQFHIQMNEMYILLETSSVNYSLLSNIERLREENKRLRTDLKKYTV